MSNSSQYSDPDIPDIVRYATDDEYAREMDAQGHCTREEVWNDMEEITGDVDTSTNYAVLYTESHPDRAVTFLGVFSTEEKAQKAIDKHMADEKARLPHASINTWNYRIYAGSIDQGEWFE